jgi:hypothetical protein
LVNYNSPRLLTPAEDDGYAPAEALPAPADLAAAGSRAGIEVLGPPGTFPNSEPV